MNRARDAIIEGKFNEYKENFINNYTQGKESEWIKPQQI